MDSVDVLILNRNYNEFLEKSLNSVLNQTYKNKNIIVVDDNSNDNSVEILDSYKDKIKLIKLNDNKPSISKTRNILLENVTSKYCTFLSSDDFFDKNYLEKQINKLNNTDNNIGGIYSDFYWVDINNNILSEVKNTSYKTKEDLNKECAKPKCVITFESTVFKSFVFDGLNFDLEVPHGEETLMGFLLSKKYNFIHNDEILAFKTRHPKQGHTEFEKDRNKFLQILKNKIMNNM
jgi:alpha-1,3-rhamnosyltransferase